MTGAVTFGDQTIKLCGNGATSIRYKQIFHKDLLMSFRGMSVEDFDADTIKGLAFVMAKQAEGADFKGITLDDFVDWISQYEEFDFMNSAADVIGIWTANNATMAKAKKK